MPATAFGHHRDQLVTSCPRKFFYAEELGLESMPSEPLVIGTAVHAGLATYHMTPYDDPLRKEKAIISAIDALQEYGPWLDRLQADGKDYEFITHKLMRDYWDFYSSVPDPWEIVAVEKEFDISLPINSPITSRHVRLTGRWDGIIRMNGVLLILEHKTTSLDLSTFLEEFALNHQITRYATAASHILQLPIVGAMVNVIRKPKPGSRTQFARQIFARGPEDQAAHLLEIEAMRAAEDVYRVRGVWPQNNASCRQWFRLCEYLPLCKYGMNSETESMYTRRAA